MPNALPVGASECAVGNIVKLRSTACDILEHMLRFMIAELIFNLVVSCFCAATYRLRA